MSEMDKATESSLELEKLLERKSHNDQRLLELIQNRPPRQQEGNKIEPRWDALQSESELFLAINLPGVLLQDVQISLNQRVLQVSGRFPESLLTNATFLRKDRPVGDFACELLLPENAGASYESALENGVLQVRIPLNPAKTPLLES